tara:strand:+ start:28357 stop:29385 length:1029 start_codon:yes stop_codon:yes gene_type:complete
MKNFKSIIFILLFFVSIKAYTQEKEVEKKVTFSGSIDTYFRTNFNGPNDENAIAPSSSFANLPGFALGMLNLLGSYEGEKVGFVADLVFGPRGEDAIFASSFLRPNGSSNIINQLYAYWKVSEKATITLGNFNTFLGYEVISPTANFNYSTSYLFSYGPFSHSGVKVDFTLSEKASIILAVMNPTDATEFNPTGNYAFGGQVGYLDQFLNFIIDDGAYEIDFTGGFDISNYFFLGINAAYFDNNGIGFTGVALYPQLAISDSSKIGVRTEYFKELGYIGAIGSRVGNSYLFAATLTGNYKVGDLIIIPEIRLDSSSDNFTLNTNLSPNSSLSSFLLAAVYKF